MTCVNLIYQLWSQGISMAVNQLTPRTQPDGAVSKLFTVCAISPVGLVQAL